MSSRIAQKVAMIGWWAKILSGKTGVAVDQEPGRAFKIVLRARYDGRSGDE